MHSFASAAAASLDVLRALLILRLARTANRFHSLSVYLLFRDWACFHRLLLVVKVQAVLETSRKSCREETFAVGRRDVLLRSVGGLSFRRDSSRPGRRHYNNALQGGILHWIALDSNCQDGQGKKAR